MTLGEPSHIPQETVCLECFAFDRDRDFDEPCIKCRRNPHHVDHYKSRWVYDLERAAVG